MMTQVPGPWPLFWEMWIVLPDQASLDHLWLMWALGEMKQQVGILSISLPFKTLNFLFRTKKTK